VSTPVDTQLLDALKALLQAAALPVVGVHVARSEADPFEPDELPAVNILPVQEDIVSPTTIGAARGAPVLQVHRFQLVVQVVTRGGSAAESVARRVSALCAQAIAQNPTLGGVCRQLLTPMAKQWVRDDDHEQRLARQNTLYSGEYRTYSHDPFTAV
jgi:hypothetical protein